MRRICRRRRHVKEICRYFASSSTYILRESSVLAISASENGGRSRRDLLPVVDIVPAGIDARVIPAGGRLSHLTRAADKQASAGIRKIFDEKGIADSVPDLHS
jgi:hypothetical protein